MADASNKTVLSDEEYVKKGGGVCPKCHSSEIEGGSVEIDGACASQGVNCLACEATWTDVYHLAGFIDLETDD